MPHQGGASATLAPRPAARHDRQPPIPPKAIPHAATDLTPRLPAGFAAALIARLPAMRRYAMALSGNAALADDLVQDSIERALKAATGLRAPDNLPAWLRRIVRNLYLDEMRRGAVRGVKVDLDDMSNDMAISVAPPDHGAVPEITRAMAVLSAEHRQILVLAGVEELTYREIAEELDVPIGTVMSRLARARAALRDAMTSPGGLERRL